MDVFFEYEQQKSSSSRSSYPNHTSYLLNQFIQGNPFQPGHFMNMVNVSNNETPLNQPSNAKISASPNNQFGPFSPASTCSNDSY